MSQKGGIFTALFIVFLIIFAGCYSVIRYTQGNDGLSIVAPFLEDGKVILPPQDEYLQRPEVPEIADYLADRWKSNPDYIKVMYFKEQQGSRIFGVVDTKLYNTGIITMQSMRPQNIIDSRGPLYLTFEFVPKSAQEISIAKQFYTHNTPPKDKGVAYAVIAKWDIDPTGSGELQSLTNDGILYTQVIFGYVLKRISNYPR
jgi:hypothetical protein